MTPTLPIDAVQQFLSMGTYGGVRPIIDPIMPTPRFKEGFTPLDKKMITDKIITLIQKELTGVQPNITYPFKVRTPDKNTELERLIGKMQPLLSEGGAEPTPTKGKVDPLIEEAKKYKSAEEFVRSQFKIRKGGKNKVNIEYKNGDVVDTYDNVSLQAVKNTFKTYPISLLPQNEQFTNIWNKAHLSPTEGKKR